MYGLIWTPKFTRTAKRFAKIHPELRLSLATILRDLELDPRQPHLRLHELRGEMEGLQAASITYKYRIILTLMMTEKEVILIDIGDHDDVSR